MKGQVWCAKFPVVGVPEGDPKPVTFIVPYYDNARFLRQQLSWWGTYPAHLRAMLSAIIVDDGSPLPAEPVLKDCAHPFPIRLFRIQKDVRWNWLAARNIGFHHAVEGWCAVTDMDHVIPQTTASALIYGQHDPSVIYGFSRSEYSGERITPHPNSWYLTRAMFWRVGGYDERLAGYYGSDGLWRRRLAATAPLKILEDRLVRYEHIEDASTARYLRKQPEDARMRVIAAKFPTDSKPTHLTFPYAEVALAKETVCL